MARHYVDITESEFSKKLETFLNKIIADDPRSYEYYDSEDSTVEEKVEVVLREGIKGKIADDLSKVVFDYENVYAIADDDVFTKHIKGIKLLPNGMPFCGVEAGGDWESPVFFILYWDGKTIRGYIPEKGNTYNVKYKTAYGSEEDSKKIKDAERIEFDWDDIPVLDSSLVIADITKRITKKD